MGIVSARGAETEAERLLLNIESREKCRELLESTERYIVIAFDQKKDNDGKPVPDGSGVMIVAHGAETRLVETISLGILHLIDMAGGVCQKLAEEAREREGKQD